MRFSDRFGAVTPFTGSPSPAIIAAAVLVAIPLYLGSLGSAPLIDPDEPYYAVPAREMVATRTWLVPVFRGELWFDKPVLYYWVVAGAFRLFGASEWSARIGSALAGLVGIISLWTLAPAAWRRTGTPFFAALVLGTSLEYAFLSRAAVTDVTLTLFLTVGFVALVRYLHGGRAGWAAAAGAAWGLGALTKGPVALIVPGLAVVGLAFAAGRLRELLRPASLALPAGFAATAAPWYLYMFVAHRDLLLGSFLKTGNFDRFVVPEHRQFPLFYVVVFAVGLLPWSAALPAALVRSFRALRKERGSREPVGLESAALIWFVAVVLPFSISASKLLTYVLPAFPAAALMIGDYWRNAFAAPGKGPRRVAAAGIALAALVSAAFALAARSSDVSGAGRWIPTLSLVLPAAAIAAWLAVRRGRPLAFLAVQAAGSCAVLAALVVGVLPALADSSSTKDLVARLDRRGFDAAVVGTYRVPDVSLDYYLGRSVTRASDLGELSRRVAERPGGIWIVRKEDLHRLGALRVETLDARSRRAAVRLAPTNEAGS